MMVRLVSCGVSRECRQAVIDRERERERERERQGHHEQEKKEESRTEYVLAHDRGQALGKLGPPRFHISQQIVLFELLRYR